MAVVWLTALAAGGCATARGPDELLIDAAQYEQVFDAAVELARREGMPAVLRDRRNGVIETETRIAGSMLEPWRADNAGFGQAVENTVNLQRRRVRFEFVPADQPLQTIPVEGELTGPDYAGAAVDPLDLTTFEGPIRVLCVVTVERNHRPGTRPNTWTNRRLTHQTQRGDVDAGLPRNFWMPVSRDEAFAARLLARLNNVLGP